VFRAAYLSKSGTTGGTSNGELLANANLLLFFRGAGVAELVDAADSKSASRKGVKVRFLSPVPFFPQKTHVLILVNALFQASAFVAFPASPEKSCAACIYTPSFFGVEKKGLI
tara:strand:- start:4 stop:342 length:339 start_codon:yes stop_codon:yes gene_type:complete